jgi:hypothetical protein
LGIYSCGLLKVRHVCDARKQSRRRGDIGFDGFGIKNSAYKGLVPMSPNTMPIAANISEMDAPFLCGLFPLEISTGLNRDDSENSGLLTDINRPLGVIAWRYVTPYKGHPKALKTLKNAFIYASF